MICDGDLDVSGRSRHAGDSATVRVKGNHDRHRSGPLRDPDDGIAGMGLTVTFNGKIGR